MLSMNKSIAQSTQKSPFEMVYGQNTQHNDVFWKEIVKQATTKLTDANAPIDEEALSRIFKDNEQDDEESVSSNDNYSSLI